MASQAALDHASLFGQLQGILSELYGEVTQHLTILPQPTQPLQNFSSPDGKITCPATEASLSLLRNTAHEMCSRWLTWDKQAERVPVDHQPILAERDLLIRRTIRIYGRLPARLTCCVLPNLNLARSVSSFSQDSLICLRTKAIAIPQSWRSHQQIQPR